MADIVNLNHYRKQKERETKKVKAAENRKKHGRTKWRQGADRLSREHEDEALDAKKLEKGEDD